jgi:hypothetical protein
MNQGIQNRVSWNKHTLTSGHHRFPLFVSRLFKRKKLIENGVKYYFAESTRLSLPRNFRPPQKGKNYGKAILKMRLEMKKREGK